MRSDRRVNQSFDNRTTDARKAAEAYKPRTLGNLRQSSSNWASSANQTAQSVFGWIGLVVLVLATATALGFAAYIFYFLFA